MLITELRAARLAKGLSQQALADAVSLDFSIIKRMELGTGTLPNLLIIMKAIELRISGLAKGDDIVQQIIAKRKALGLTVKSMAMEAGISRVTLTKLERGEGSVAPLLKLLDIIGTKAYRTKLTRVSFAGTRSHENDKRFTPRWFVDHIASVFGEIDLDPCGHDLAEVMAKRIITLPEDGLTASWSGHDVIYVNPPFSGAAKWLAKAADSFEAGDIKTIVVLIPARTDGAAFQQRVAGIADVGFMAGRLAFAAPAGVQSYPAPFSMMLVVWGATDDQINRLNQLIPCRWMRAA